VSNGVSWVEFETASPLIAERSRWLLSEHYVAFLATMRPSGAPQVRPIAPFFAEGALWALIVNLSSKHGDLLRDGRFALHFIPAGPENLEVHIEGRALRSEDTALASRIASGAERALHDFESLFELRVERAQSTRWQGWGTPQIRPEFVRWSAP
jgi:hypothetical protein